MNLIQKNPLTRFYAITVKLITALFLALTLDAFAASDPAYCEMIGSLARGITEDRDRGVSYNAALGKIKGAAEGVPSAKGILQIAKGTLKMVYMDMPNITPEGAFNLNYLACMKAK